MDIKLICGMIVALIGSQGFWEFIKYKMQHKSALHQCTLAIARDHLYQGCKCFLKQGSISMDDLENITELYESYAAMGGNGTGAELFNRVKRLPLEETIKKEEL